MQLISSVDKTVLGQSHASFVFAGRAPEERAGCCVDEGPGFQAGGVALGTGPTSAQVRSVAGTKWREVWPAAWAFWISAGHS